LTTSYIAINSNRTESQLLWTSPELVERASKLTSKNQGAP